MEEGLSGEGYMYKQHSLDGVEVYGCLLCGKTLSRKQRIQSHLVSIHNRSPVKERKRYLQDASIPKPKRTVRWQKSKVRQLVKSTEECDVAHESMVELDNDYTFLEPVDGAMTPPSCSTTEVMSIPVPGDESLSSSDSDSYSAHDSFDETSSDCDETMSDSDISVLDELDTDCNQADGEDCSMKTLSAHESQAFCLVSYLLKYNLSASAGKYLLQLLQTLCPESEYFRKVKHEELFRDISENEPDVIHYCCICNNTFPDDPDIFQCPLDDCPGLRYIGPVSNQKKSNRQPRCFFIIADVESQLQSLVERNDIWDEVQKTKQSIKLDKTASYITDIIDGAAYLKHCQPEGCLHSDNALSAIFNTDGVPLFNSSKVKLWPIFLCINELICSRKHNLSRSLAREG